MITSGDEGGLVVTIELPFEARAPAPPPARSVHLALNPAVAR